MILNCRNVDARHHDVAGLFLAQGEDALEHLLVFLLLDVGDFKRLSEVIGGNILMFALHIARHEGRRAHHDLAQRAEQTVSEEHGTAGTLGPAARAAAGRELGQNLAEEEQQEGEQYSLDEKLHYAVVEMHRLIHGEVEQDDHGDVHQVVAYEYGCQQAFGVMHQEAHAPALATVFLLQVFKLCRVEAEKGYLRHKGRHQHT